MVQHCYPLGDACRVVDRRRDVEDARAHVDVRRLGRHEGEEGLRCRQVRVIGQEVVLGGPGVLEARLVSRHNEGDLVHDAVVFGGVAVQGPVLGQQAGRIEDPEFHGLSTSSRTAPQSTPGAPAKVTRHTLKCNVFQ